MQLSDMVGRVRKTLGEVEPSGYGTQQAGQGTWDNSQIIGYLNEALGILAHDWRKEKTAPITFTAVNQTSFALPTDALEDGLRMVGYVTNNTTDPTQATEWPVQFVDFDRFKKLSALPLPQPSSYPYNHYIYTVWGGNILIYPGSAQTTDSLNVYYFRVPVTLVNAGDVPEIPARFHIALVEYAIAECQNAVEEANLEYDAQSKWEALVQQFRMEMYRNQRDRGVRVRGRR